MVHILVVHIMVILVHVMSPWIVPLKIIMYVNPYGIQLGESNSLDKSCGIYLRLSRVVFIAVIESILSLLSKEIKITAISW